MKKEDLKKGFMIINGGEPDVPSKERQEEIIKLMTEDFRKEIDKPIDVAKQVAKTCYCGSPIDYSDPDCVKFSLCKDHAMDV